MKKINYLIISVVLALLVTGCSSNKIRITEDESNAIAQYSAYLLMKHDKNGTVKEKLLDTADLEAAKQGTEEGKLPFISRPEVTPSATIEPAPTEEPAIKPYIPESETNNSEIPETSEASSETESIKVPDSEAAGDIKVPENIISEATEKVQREVAEAIAGCYMDDTFDITYRNYEVCESYKSDLEYFSIKAPAGSKLLILNFDVKNVSKSKSHFDFSKQKVKFQLIGDETKTLEPRISLLANDLQFLNTDIESGKSVQAVLLFYIDDIFSRIDLKVLGNFVNEKEPQISYEIKIN